MNITSKTRLNMVIGYPIGHSKSPLLHQAVYKALEIDAVLLAQSHSSLADLIQTIKTLSVGLTAVTAPYKERVIAYLDACSPEVSLLQAANTIIQRDGKLYGYNTDIDGIAFALCHIDVNRKKVLVLGAGGAAQAMGYFLKKNHAHMFVLNRTEEKASRLANRFGGQVITHQDCTKHHFDMIVNTTPIGLYPNVDESPLPEDIFYAGQIVFDMVYNPVQTKCLQQATAKQATPVSGLEMFIGQGLKQIELLTGKRYPAEQIDDLRSLLTLNRNSPQK